MSELRNVNVTEAKELLDEGALLLDVREDGEWEAGRTPSAIHIALAELPDHLGTLERTRRIVCVCRAGGRSARATRFLVEQGFDAVNLDGGMLSWASEGEPLVGDHAEPTVI